jgi:hypothetical protein
MRRTGTKKATLGKKAAQPHFISAVTDSACRIDSSRHPVCFIAQKADRFALLDRQGGASLDNCGRCRIAFGKYGCIRRVCLSCQ